MLARLCCSLRRGAQDQAAASPLFDVLAHSCSYATSSSRQPKESLSSWISSQYPPLSFEPGVSVRGGHSPRTGQWCVMDQWRVHIFMHHACMHAGDVRGRGGIPPFPGFPNAELSSHAAVDFQASFNLSAPAVEALKEAVRLGTAPSDPTALGHRLKELSSLRQSFPGFDIDLQIQSDASFLAFDRRKVFSAMRQFMLLAPRHLPPVGSLMQQIGGRILVSQPGQSS